VLKLALPYRLRLTLAVLGMTIEAAAAAAFVRMIEPMLDDVFGARDPSVIAWLPWAIVALFAIRGMGVFLGDYSAAWVSRRVIFDLRTRCFGHYLNLPDRYYVQASSGEMLARLTNYSEEVGRTITDGYKALLLDGLTLTALLAVMFYQSWQLSLFVLLMGPVIGLVVTAVGRRYRRVSRRIQASLADVNTVATQVLNGQREVKVYAAQSHEAARFHAINLKNFLQNLKIIATNAISTSSVQFLAAIALATVVYLASHGLTDEQMTPGAFMSFILAMLACLPSLKRLTSVQASFARGMTALDTIEQVLAEPPERDQGQRELTRAQGELAFHEVSVRYPGAETDALHQVSLRIPAGKTVALVGRSGGGKSTLASLVPRFADPESGWLSLDGIDLRELKLRDLRAQIALVSQQVVLFNDSVANNIAYGALRACSAAEIETAARAAQAHEFIMALPNGYASNIGENGATLSGGQRQRLAIARALLKNAPLLILDEATSALDNESERLIQQAFEALRRGRTTLLIAHRLSTVERADWIIVMERGVIAEQGIHSELLAKGGLYSQLYRQGSELQEPAEPST